MSKPKLAVMAAQLLLSFSLLNNRKDFGVRKIRWRFSQTQSNNYRFKINNQINAKRLHWRSRIEGWRNFKLLELILEEMVVLPTILSSGNSCIPIQNNKCNYYLIALTSFMSLAWTVSILSFSSSMLHCCLGRNRTSRRIVTRCSRFHTSRTWRSSFVATFVS